MYVDWNRENILEPFMLKGSNHHFVSRVIDNDFYFIDLDSDEVVPFDCINAYDLDFFREKDDVDYLGVWIDD